MQNQLLANYPARTPDAHLLSRLYELVPAIGLIERRGFAYDYIEDTGTYTSGLTGGNCAAVGGMPELTITLQDLRNPFYVMAWVEMELNNTGGLCLGGWAGGDTSFGNGPTGVSSFTRYAYNTSLGTNYVVANGEFLIWPVEGPGSVTIYTRGVYSAFNASAGVIIRNRKLYAFVL